MSISKVEFKLEMKEENKSFSFILIVIFVGSIFSLLVLLFAGSDQSMIYAQITASEWGEAELQNNEPMKYRLLSDSEKVKYVDIVSETNKGDQPTYSFKNKDMFQWKITRNEYVYKFHYYNMKNCEECQKDVWVRVRKEEIGWVVPHIQFSETMAEPLIHGIERVQIPTSEDQEKELEEKKSIIVKLFNL
ncbi:hypothetical protein AWM68_03350 [Fictibacillus phosphorivorans]|uniref:Uncharacterized protein n=1 Tax=Fictibacillus phosphorivorans TaxID=1221500 RepID=A0A161RX47_9BACL|nr:hypothetical protein [Fictibacillus phosphorivorans]KZE69316.1 hypothetical protein AWM68_03350 [Fictibacillus phosphorivorans]